MKSTQFLSISTLKFQKSHKNIVHTLYNLVYLHFDITIFHQFVRRRHYVYITKLSKVKKKNSFTLWGHRTRGDYSAAFENGTIRTHSQQVRKVILAGVADSGSIRVFFVGFRVGCGATLRDSRATEDCRRLSLEKNTASSIFRVAGQPRFHRAKIGTYSRVFPRELLRKHVTNVLTFDRFTCVEQDTEGATREHR